MITAEMVGYEFEEQENISVKDLQKSYSGNVILWMTGSADSAGDKSGKFRYVLQFNEGKKYYEGDLKQTTANRAMILGAIDAIKKMNKPAHIYLVVATSLGFQSGFKGKGPNGDLIQKLLELIAEKKCTFTEVKYTNGANNIKRLVYSVSGDEGLIHKLEGEEHQNRTYQNKYKETIYEECLAKVRRILEVEKVDSKIIALVQDIKPE